VLNILGSDSEDEDENEEDTTEADVSYRVSKKRYGNSTGCCASQT
jgi:hypothetical protein